MWNCALQPKTKSEPLDPYIRPKLCVCVQGATRNIDQMSATPAPTATTGAPAAEGGINNNITTAAAGTQQQQGNVNAAAATGGVPASSAVASSSSSIMDLASVLSKIQSLEKEKADMRAQLDMATSKLSKLQESKRVEMEQMMNSTISKWLENLNTSDAAAKEQLKEGLNRLVQSGDESGVWNVIACASSNWVSNVNQIEQLTTQLNEYREKERLLSGGIFQSEESRVGSHAIPPAGEKRKIDSISEAHGATSGSPGDIWSEFQSMMMSRGGNVGYDYGMMVAGSRGDAQMGV